MQKNARQTANPATRGLLWPFFGKYNVTSDTSKWSHDFKNNDFKQESLPFVCNFAVIISG